MFSRYKTQHERENRKRGYEGQIERYYLGGGFAKGKRTFSKQKSNSWSGERGRSIQEDTVRIPTTALYTITTE